MTHAMATGQGRGRVYQDAAKSKRKGLNDGDVSVFAGGYLRPPLWHPATVDGKPRNRVGNGRHGGVSVVTRIDGEVHRCDGARALDGATWQGADGE